MLRRLATSLGEEEGVSLPFPEQRLEDRQALELVRTCRRRVLLKLWPDTAFTLRSLMDLSLDLMQQIAAIYHPEEDRPELQASLAELVNLQARISVRLQTLLETVPLVAFKDLKLQTMLYCHDIYKLCVSHPAYRFLRQHRFDKVVRWVWMVKNFTSPWYWGRRAAFTGGKELLGRFFLARVITIVGVEAIRLYSGRTPGLELERLYELTWQEVCSLTAGKPAYETAALKFFLNLVLKSQELPEAAKLSLIARMSRPVAGPQLHRGTLDPAERRRIERWLQQLIKNVFPPQERPSKLQEIRHHLAEFPEKVAVKEQSRSKRG